MNARTPPAEPDAGRRVLDVTTAARYIGLSRWSLYDYVAGGLIRPLALPALRPREGERPRQRLRRLLFDRVDLDAFIDRVKAGSLAPGRGAFLSPGRPATERHR